MAQKPSDNVAHALAGAGGGLLSMTLTYPLITLSTRAQVARHSSSSPSRATTLALIRQILAREGVSGLFSGLSSALFGITITNFVYYYWYEWSKAFLLRTAAAKSSANGAAKSLSTVQSMLAGALAGIATVILTNPIWVVNTRMTVAAHRQESADGDEAARDQKPGTIATLLALLRESGPTALFAGILPALVLVINPILQYTIFEKLSQLLLKYKLSKSEAVGPLTSSGHGAARITPRDAFLLGALGKVVATGATYPYLVVKSRMHVKDRSSARKSKRTTSSPVKEQASEEADLEKGKEAAPRITSPARSEGDHPDLGIIGSLQQIVQKEGYSGLYKGVGPKMAQSVITAAFLFAFKDALYEASLKVRGNQAVKENLAKAVKGVKSGVGAS